MGWPVRNVKQKGRCDMKNSREVILKKLERLAEESPGRLFVQRFGASTVVEAIASKGYPPFSGFNYGRYYDEVPDDGCVYTKTPSSLTNALRGIYDPNMFEFMKV